MDTDRFDHLIRSPNGTTRRAATRTLAVGALLAALGLAGEAKATTRRGRRRIGTPCARARQCRSGRCFVLSGSRGVCAPTGCIGQGGACRRNGDGCGGHCNSLGGRVCDNI